MSPIELGDLGPGDAGLYCRVGHGDACGNIGPSSLAVWGESFFFCLLSLSSPRSFFVVVIVVGFRVKTILAFCAFSFLSFMSTT